MESRTVSTGSILLVIVGWGFSAITLLILASLFVSTPSAPEWSGPIGEWIDIGYERRRLRELDQMNLFSRPEFDAEDAQFLEQELSILAKFPPSREQFEAERDEQIRDTRRMTEAKLWTVIAVWVLTSTSTLCGIAFLWKHDRRIALESEQKLRELAQATGSN